MKQLPLFNGSRKGKFKFPEKVLAERGRIRARNRYRMKHNIPLDQPVWLTHRGRVTSSQARDNRTLDTVNHTLL